MDLNLYIEEVEKDCYSYKTTEVFAKISGIIEQLATKSVHLDILKLMTVAMEKKDLILLGDCLEYGVKPYLRGEEVNIEMFNENIALYPNLNENQYYLSTYSNEPTLCVKNANEIVRLNSFFSPENEVNKWITNINIKKTTTIVCMFGIGTGLFAEKILERLPENAKLLIDEPNQNIIDYCIECGTAENCEEVELKIKERLNRIIEDDRVVLLVETKDEISHNSLMAKALESRDYIAMLGMIITKHNGYDLAFPKQYLNFLHAINDFQVKMFSNRNIVSYFKEKYMENFIYNLHDFKQVNSCGDIEKILPKNIPVVIVSAGPSLSKNIEILKQAKGHSLIIAVDTAIRFLLKNNIVPDITVSLDPDKPEDYYSDELSHIIPCMFDVDANPKIVHKHKGRIFLFNCSNAYVNLLGKQIGKYYYPLTDVGGSVATAPFALMRDFKQKKIILIGQDLAYVDGRTHVGDIDDGATTVKTEVDGINGEKVTTRSDWLSFLKWFEKQIDKMNQNEMGIEVIDATEGGALIHGTKVMTFIEALNSCKDANGRLPDYDFEKIIEKMEPFMTEDEYFQFYKKYEDSIYKLKEIEIKASDAIRICRNLLIGIEKDTVSNTYIDKEKKKIFKINEFCRKNIVFPLINAYIVSDIVDDVGCLMFSEGNPKDVEINRIRMLKLSFEAILDATLRIRERAKKIKAERENSI